MRTSSRPRNSQSHRNRRENSLQSVHRDRVGFVTDLDNNKFLVSLKYLVGTSVRRR